MVINHLLNGMILQVGRPDIQPSMKFNEIPGVNVMVSYFFGDSQYVWVLFWGQRGA